MNFDTVEKLSELVPSLDTGFLDTEDFRDFYKVSFFFVVFVSLVHQCCSCHVLQFLNVFFFNQSDYIT